MRNLSSLLAACTLAGALTAQQQLLLPPTHHLSLQATQVPGSPSIFRSTAGRFATIIEASNFPPSGVTGPITINKLRFRAEDTETNLGGQTYANVTVRVGTTSLTTTSFTGVWAANWAPSLPFTTSGGTPLLIPSLVLGPSLGTAPNNYCIEIDLAALGGAVLYDPSSAEPNLLIEVIMPTAPTFTIGTTLALPPIQQTIGTAAQLGSTAFTSSNPTGTINGTTINGPVVQVEFQGAGGYTTLIPARVESYGAACGGSPSCFYEQWTHNQKFDLANTTLVMIPDNPVAPNFYTVLQGTSAVDVTKVNATPNSTGDDNVVAHPLGFTLNYPGGGSTTSLQVWTNGFFFLDAGTVAQTWVPTRDKWLGTSVTETARFAPIWHDWHCGRNASTHPNSGLHVFSDTSGGPGNFVSYLTWLNVARANINAGAAGASVNTFQCVIFEATGIVEFRYGAMTALEGANSTSASATGFNTGITGFTRGNIAGAASRDPQSRDLSLELPFTTSVEGATGNIGLVPVQAPTVPTNAPGRLFAGQTITYNVNNIPAGSILGVLFLDFVALRPGIQFPGITAPGCMLSVTPSATAWELFPNPTSSVTGVAPVTVPSGYLPSILGVDVHAQFLVLDGLFGAPDLITASSHALRHTVGLQ